jgi:hypothetical protein
MNRNSWLLILVFILGCHSKRVSLRGNTKVDADDFISSFESSRPPFKLTDSIFNGEQDDSDLIGYPVFTQFIPDSVIARHYSHGPKPDIYPVAGLIGDHKINYLFCLSETETKKLLYLLCLDGSGHFINSKMIYPYDPDFHSSVSVDSKFTFNTDRERHGPDGEIYYRKEAFFLNDSGKFNLILTESNEPSAHPAAVPNPIDTLPKKHRLSGDYLLDKRNIVSIRDGKNASWFLFFIHFEKEGGSCVGELKGEARFNSGSTGRYHSSKDPCTIDFNFNGNKVEIKEVEGCGNHRDIKCFFEGSYPRKKETKSRQAITRKKRS